MPQTMYASNDLDRGNLVNAREIAWGPAFEFKGDVDAAGKRAYGLATIMTDVVPQFDTFNQGLWTGVEHYSQQAFRADSDRVIIFSGPVFSQDDPQLYDIAVPRSFWKVLITTRPDNPASLLVEAYRAPQFKGDGKTKIERNVRFDAKMSFEDERQLSAPCGHGSHTDGRSKSTLSGLRDCAIRCHRADLQPCEQFAREHMCRRCTGVASRFGSRPSFLKHCGPSFSPSRDTSVQGRERRTGAQVRGRHS